MYGTNVMKHVDELPVITMNTLIQFIAQDLCDIKVLTC